MKWKDLELIFLMLFFLIPSNGCKEDDPSPAIHEFPGLVFKDEFGQTMGIFGGPDDNDWKYDSAWTPEIHALLNFNDSVDLTGTYLDSSYISGIEPGEILFNFFPNPVRSIAIIYIILPGHVKVKMALVDSCYNSVLTHSFKDSDTAWIGLDMRDDSRFNEGVVYRMFYTMSVEGNIDFYKGHGDILMCEDLPPNTCLRFIDDP